MVQALEEIIPQDLPRAFELLKEMNDSVHQVTDLVDSMLERVKRGEISTEKEFGWVVCKSAADLKLTEMGLSFLEMKYHMLLSYLINLTYVVLRKCSGEKIEGDPAIDRLVEIRTVLEKIRPIDQKLKYQIGKLVKTAVTGAADVRDPASFRADPGNLASKLGEEDTGGSSSEQDQPDGARQERKGAYVPPKIAAVHYDGDESRLEKQQRLAERARRAALNSSVIQELREEYLDTPIEVAHEGSARVVPSRRHRQREEYEESYFTRLPTTKQERRKSRELTTVGSLGEELTRFGDVRALEGVAGPSSPARKRKSSAARKGKKGFKKRKLH